jgi:hypothetical protein
MSTAAFIQQCVDAGVPLEMAVKAASAFEEQAGAMVERELAKHLAKEVDRRATNSDRMRRKRERDATLRNVTQHDATARTPSPQKTFQPNLSKSSLDQNPTPIPPIVPPSLAKPNGFARFWEAYPNKVGKPKAAEAYAKALRRADAETILAGLERANDREWRESLGHPPHPTTWLNGDRWADEPAEIARPPPPMTGSMVAAASDEIAFRNVLEKLNGNAPDPRNHLGNQGALVALPQARQVHGR